MFRKEEIKKLTVHKDPQINAKILKLYGKALKQFPNSPAQLKTSAEINRLLRMPAPQTDKDKLKAKSVDQLKRQAKKVGAKLVTPEGKAKTKDQLINSIIMKERLSGKSDSQTGKSNTAKDLQRSAKAPGKRTSAKGKTYYERRANRSDKPGSLLENGSAKIMNVAQTIYRQLGGGRFATMTGAKNFVDGGSFLSFKLPSNFAKGGINYVKITLTPLDLYDMEFGKIRGNKYTISKTKRGLYNDMLRSTFTAETGLNTSL